MDNTLNILGLAYKARKAVLGEEIFNRISKVRLIFLASDLSEKSRERYEKKCFYYNIEHIDSYDSAQLSAALGKNNVKTVGITDEGFARSIMKNQVKEVENG
ncbi:MAG: ribosomal L7Ae/L30e/S12e/Gadd45 family protein [Erysipelotrichaceae bacterium]|nr:ribosomal L7Ae/L30e/S12e/Gadd45 family protein [Erysipelotrichaceae bacterium]